MANELGGNKPKGIMDSANMRRFSILSRFWQYALAILIVAGVTAIFYILGDVLLDTTLVALLYLIPLGGITAYWGYRVVDTDGTIQLASNRYSVPWQLVGQQLPVRVTEESLVVYSSDLSPVARYALFQGQTGQRRMDPTHAPPKDHEAQMERLRERFTELGESGCRFFAGLLVKQRHVKHQAAQVLALLHAYPKADVLAAMERAIAYHAFSFSSLERILAHQGTPKATWQQLSAHEQETILRLTDIRLNSRFPVTGLVEHA